MNEPHQWAGRSGEFAGVPTETAPRPEVNDTCPECNIGIADGSGWRMDPDGPGRIHSQCIITRRQRLEREERDRLAAETEGVGQKVDEYVEAHPEEFAAAEPQPNTADPLSPLELAKSLSTNALEVAQVNPGAAVVYLGAALNELVRHLEAQQ